MSDKPPRSKAAIALYVAAVFSTVAQIAGTAAMAANLPEPAFWFFVSKFVFAWILPVVFAVCGSLAQKISDIHWYVVQKASRPNA